MMAYPQFLNEEELTDYKKDTCLFCNERFRTRSKSSSHEEWSGGCYSDHKYTVTTTTNYVADLDLYHFSFKFSDEDEQNLRQRQKELKEHIITQKEEEAPILEQRLREYSLELPEPWKDKKEQVIKALINDYLSELRPRLYCDISPLNQRLDKLFHNLELGDLQLVEKNYDHSPRGSQTGYCPRGLKSHHRCWPYAPLSEPTQLALPFGQLVEPVLKNKRFADYEKLFTETPEIWKDVQQMPITLNAQPYNPVDWMVR